MRDRLPRQRLHRPLRAHHAGLGLVEHERQVVRAEARVTASRPPPGRAARTGCPARSSRARTRPPSRPRAGRTRPCRSRPSGPRPSRPRARARACGRAAPTRCRARRRRASSGSAATRRRRSRGASPGSNWSTSTTSSPARASVQASEAPKVPAPTITVCTLWHATRVLAALAVAATLAAPPATLPPRITGGRSVRGTPIVAVRSGPADAPVRVLATGSIHGTEPAGLAVIRRLRRIAPPEGVQVWTVRTVNPDGLARGTRQNVHGVDLNRNFPRRWRGGGQPFDGYYPGPSAASEPETRALMRLVRRIRPDISIHYHQDFGLVNLTGGPDAAIVRDYARRSGLPAKRLPRPARDRHGLAEHALPAGERLRGRAPRRGAERRGRAPPRPRGARRGGEPGRARERRRGSKPRDRLVADPVRRRPRAPDARLRQPPLRARPRAAARSRRRSSSTSRRPAPTGRRGTRSRPTRPTSSSASARASARTSSSTATARSTSSCG